MKPDYQIVEARPYHCGQIVRRMRTAHLEALAPTGKNPHRELRDIMGRSLFAKTCVMDGKPVAMWGVCGTLLGNGAYAWLILSNDVLAYRVSLMKEAVRQMKIIISQYGEVATTVLGTDDAALRFATFLGFHDRHDDDIPLARKDVADLVRKDAQMRVTVGNTFVYAVGCHSDSVH